MDSIYFKIFCWVYRAGGRAVLRQYMNDPYRSWDETAMGMLDKVTGYENRTMESAESK